MPRGSGLLPTVCSVVETETPHRMGAALTYARRYALFTLVGIAGEDDLDAPDVAASISQKSESAKPITSNRKTNGSGPPNTMVPSAIKLRKGQEARPAKPALVADLSAALCQLSLAEISDLGSSDDAALWAHRSMGRKNTLIAADAEQVDEKFQAKLMTLTARGEISALPENEAAMAGISTGEKSSPVPEQNGIDKSVLKLPEPRRVRDREHVRSVMGQPCSVCGRVPSDAHHLRFAQKRALGRKVSDEFTVPLCRGHHRELHRHGDEAELPGGQVSD
jgi:hypothetical protein